MFGSHDQAIVDLWLVPPQEDDGDAGDNGGTGPPGPSSSGAGEGQREMTVWCERCGVGFYH